MYCLFLHSSLAKYMNYHRDWILGQLGKLRNENENEKERERERERERENVG